MGLYDFEDNKDEYSHIMPIIVAMGVVAAKTLGHGIAVAPYGLFTNYWDDEALNISAVLQQLASVKVIAVAIITVATGIFGFRFLFYRMRKLQKLEPRLYALPTLTAVLAIVGAAHPSLLPAVPIVWLMAMLALLAEVGERV